MGVVYSRKIYDYNYKESPPSLKVTRNLVVCESLGGRRITPSAPYLSGLGFKPVRAGSPEGCGWAVSHSGRRPTVSGLGFQSSRAGSPRCFGLGFQSSRAGSPRCFGLGFQSSRAGSPAPLDIGPVSEPGPLQPSPHEQWDANHFPLHATLGKTMSSVKFRLHRWVEEDDFMIPVVVESETVACGGRRKLPKLPEFTLQLLSARPLLRRRVWTSCCRKGEVKVVLSRERELDGAVRERRDVQTEREKLRRGAGAEAALASAPSANSLQRLQIPSAENLQRGQPTASANLQRLWRDCNYLPPFEKPDHLKISGKPPPQTRQSRRTVTPPSTVGSSLFLSIVFALVVTTYSPKGFSWFFSVRVRVACYFRFISPLDEAEIWVCGATEYGGAVGIEPSSRQEQPRSRAGCVIGNLGSPDIGETLPKFRWYAPDKGHELNRSPSKGGAGTKVPKREARAAGNGGRPNHTEGVRVPPVAAE
uniref:Uncharacterized protein n=1 Tax=Salix viminalis TaxID=40686 RepID=A0A6N2MM16_SALVM